MSFFRSHAPRSLALAMGNTNAKGELKVSDLSLPIDGSPLVLTDGDLVDLNPSVEAERCCSFEYCLVVAPFSDPKYPSTVFTEGQSFRPKKAKLISAAESTVRTMDADFINTAMAAAGSALAFRINMAMSQRILGSKTTAKSGVLSLAYNLAAIAGCGTHLLILEFNEDGQLIMSPLLKEKLRVEGISEAEALSLGAKAFNVTAAAANLSKDLWVSASTYLSREACSAFARRHTLGAFAMPRGQAVPTGTSDKFVLRCATCLGLTLGSEADRAVYYTCSKVLDRIKLIYDQITVAMKDDLIGEGQLCDWRKLSLQILSTDTRGTTVPLVAIAFDRTTLPRISQGPSGRRFLVRALQCSLEVIDSAACFVTGTQIDVRRLRESLAASMPLIRLGHPAVTGVLPQGLSTLMLKAENQMLFQSARRVIACFAGFEEGRTEKKSEAPADSKACKQHQAIYEAAKSWGARFGVKRLDETTAGKLVEALSAVQGGATLTVTDAGQLKALYSGFQQEMESQKEKDVKILDDASKTIPSDFKLVDFSTGKAIMEKETSALMGDVTAAFREASTYKSPTVPKIQMTPSETMASRLTALGSSFGFTTARKKAKTTDFVSLARWLGKEKLAKLLQVTKKPKISADDLNEKLFDVNTPLPLSDLGYPTKELVEVIASDVSGELKKIIDKDSLLLSAGDMVPLARALHQYATVVGMMTEQPVVEITGGEAKELYTQHAFCYMQVIVSIADLVGGETPSYEKIGFRFEGNVDSDTELGNLKPEGLTDYKL